MNTSTPTTEATDVGEAGTIEQRTASLMDELRADPSQPAGEVEEDAEGSPASTAPVASPADSDAEQRRAERRKRLEAFAQQERQSVDHKERQAYAEKQAQRAKEAEDKLAAMSQGTFDRAVLKDPLAVMRMMEEAGVDASQVAEAIRESISNPNVAASRAAREAVSPELAEAKAIIARQEARLSKLEGERESERAAITERQHVENFVSHINASAQHTPLAAALLKHDREEFIEMANIASQKVPPGSGREALADALEELLDKEARGVFTKYSAIYGAPIATPPSQATRTRSGAVQPTTLSNTLAQERGSLADEEDWAHLTVEERARRLSKSL